MAGSLVAKEAAAVARWGSMMAAEIAGYLWDPVKSEWYQAYPDSAQVIPAGTTFIDITPSGEYKYDSRALNTQEQERVASGWAAENQRMLREHEEWTRREREKLASQLLDFERQKATAQGPTIHPGSATTELVAPVRPDPTHGGIQMYTAVNDPSRSLTGTILGGLTGFLTGGPGGALIGAGLGMAGAYDTNGQYTGATSGYNPGYSGSTGTVCPPGYQLDSQGRCAATGVTGWLQQTIPGGQTGYLPAGQVGTPVGGVTGYVQQALPGGQTGYVQLQPAQGAFGVGALPAQVQLRKLLCPPGMVLGKDSVCYARRQLNRNERKHPPERKPLLSAMDGKVLERAHQLETKLNRVAGRFLAPPKPAAKKKGRGRARK